MKYLIVFFTLLFFASCSEVNESILVPEKSDLVINELVSFLEDNKDGFWDLTEGFSEPEISQEEVLERLAINVDLYQFESIVASAIQERERFENTDLAMETVFQEVRAALENQANTRLVFLSFK